MSLATQIEELKAMLAERTEQLGLVSGELTAKDSEIADLRDANTHAVADSQDAFETFRAAAEKTQAALVDAMAEQAEAVEAQRVDLETHATRIAELTSELAAAHLALGNPAYADAGARGEEAPAADGGEGATGTESKTPIYDGFKALRDAGHAQAATAYWNEHEAEIHAEQKAAIA